MKRIKSFSAIITSFVMAFSGVVALPVSAKNDNGNNGSDEKFTITYELNGGKFEKEPVTIFDKNAKNIDLAIPVREHYEFSCWHRKSDFKDDCVTGIKKINKDENFMPNGQQRPTQSTTSSS